MGDHAGGRNGELFLTYQVSVWCNGTMILHLGTGFSAVQRFIKIASEGIPEAKEIKELWDNNYKVAFTGENLKEFLKKHYPETEPDLYRIRSKEEYVLDCYDMS